MSGVATALLLWTGVLFAEFRGEKADPKGAETLHRLGSEFDLAQQTAFDLSARAATAEEKGAAVRATPDPREYARKCLELARTTADETVAVDALVWIVRHAGRTPEHGEAIGQIEARFIRSDRIAGACWPVATDRERGEGLLRRIVEENPNPNIRGQACLGLAFANRVLLRDVRRFRALPAAQRDERLKKDQIDRLEKADPDVLLASAERWVERMLEEFPSAILNDEASDFFPLLSNDLGLGAESFLRRAIAEHPDPRTRREAECALLVQQMRLAPRAVQAARADVSTRFLRSFDDVAGGLARARSIDPHKLAPEIDRRLRSLADGPEVPPQPETAKLARAGINLYHLLTDLGTEPQFHTGAEILLRRLAEVHPEERVRALARRSLALHLAKLAETSARLRFAAGMDLDDEVALIGADRVAQICGLDVVKLERESKLLAERVDSENLKARGVHDRAIEALLKTPGDAIIGQAAPEIEGADLDGLRFKLGDYRGRVVLLDFWNHRTCAPCREAYPKLRDLVKRFEGRPFVLLGVNTDDTHDDLAQVVADREITWRFWLKHGTEADPTFVRWMIGGIPGLVLLDQNGVVRVRYEGTPSEETLESAINALLAEAKDAK